MKKLLASFLIFSFASKLLAAEGVIIVLEAPLFEKEDTKSRILQYVRKGDRIFIHDRHAGISTDDPDYGQVREVPYGDFYFVQDKNGREAYVPRKYVKRIMKDQREYAEKISPFDHDPTDYRLKEPLPPKYPIVNEERYRAIANFALGPARKVNYPYPNGIQTENFAPRMGVELSYLKNIEYDTINRFYFGAKFHFWQDEANFELGSGKTAKEQHGQFGVGPTVTYDAYRDDDYRVCFTGGFSFNWNRTLATIEGPDEEENRIFSAFTITPEVGTLLQFPKVLPHIDLVLGTALQFNLPYVLNPQGPAINAESWNAESDSLSYPLGGNLTAFLGLQSSY